MIIYNRQPVKCHPIKKLNIVLCQYNETYDYSKNRL